MKSIPKPDFESLSARTKKFRRNSSKFYRETIKSHLKDRSLRQIERFVFSWLAVFVLGGVLLANQMGAISEHYLEPGPADGSQYVEGMVGEIGSLNPIFSDSQVSEAANRLIFSGLVQADSPEGVRLDLAESYEINESQTVYGFVLRDDIYWHDGRPVTTADVAFTIDAIQNPDVGSHLQVNWRDIEVEVIDDRRMEFILPNPYAPFISQLAVGILPRHLLEDTSPERMRVTSFNQEPVGSGPFMFDEISSSQQIRTRANPNYHLGIPRLERFTIATFESETEMTTAYDRGELAGMSFGSTFNSSDLTNLDRTEVHQIDIAGQVFAFYNTARIGDRDLRQALTQSVNTGELRQNLGENYRFADSPLLPGQLGYRSSQLQFDLEAAKEKFEEAGWRVRDGELVKDGEQLQLNLVTQDNYSYPRAAEILETFWEQAGADVEITLASGVDLQEEYLRPRNFDVLVYGIGLDRDPDVYAYWHSSQERDPGRNVSRYQSESADVSLEDGRTRIDKELRAAKYESFQERWRQDAPATALYRLHAYYVHRQEARGLDFDHIILPVERYHNVHQWTINTEPVMKRLQP